MKKFLIYDINSSMINEFKTKDEYTEYGYRGVEELKRLETIIDSQNKDIKECNKLIEELKITIQELKEKWQN